MIRKNPPLHWFTSLLHCPLLVHRRKRKKLRSNTVKEARSRVSSKRFGSREEGRGGVGGYAILMASRHVTLHTRTLATDLDVKKKKKVKTFQKNHRVLGGKV